MLGIFKLETISISSIVLIICLIISTGCLGAGYILAGYWQILAVFPLMALFWIYTKNRSAFWADSSFLLAYLILAAIGIVDRLSLVLMIIACTTVLTSWDLMQFNHSKVGNSLSNTNTALEKYHLNSLALAASAGLILALSSIYINLQFPFGVTILLVLIAMGCFLYSLRYIRSKKY